MSTGIKIGKNAENTQIISCEFENLDVGIDNSGKNTKSVNNRFVHEKNVIEKAATKPKKQWYQFWLVKYILFPVVVGIIILLITKYSK